MAERTMLEEITGLSESSFEVVETTSKVLEKKDCCTGLHTIRKKQRKLMKNTRNRRANPPREVYLNMYLRSYKDLAMVDKNESSLRG